MFVRPVAALLLSLPLACFAQVYQYKDAQGRTVFSDSPPPGVSATRKNVPVPPAAAAPEGESPVQDKMQEFQKRREERLEKEAKDAKEKAAREKAAENCSRVRNRLAALRSGQRIVRFNEQGEREYIDDEARNREIEQTEKSVSEWCK
ncbi:DUF4124 domain-containing protein [Methyloversatilis sp.]|uniref:DUF4124 domain-containing protein n=1 Tax=Methyloversatilis sp. TaxID=2569862 RepID=UPI0035B43A3B